MSTWGKSKSLRTLQKLVGFLFFFWFSFYWRKQHFRILSFILSMEAGAKNTLSHFSVSSLFVNIKEWDLCCCCSDISFAANRKKRKGGGTRRSCFLAQSGSTSVTFFPRKPVSLNLQLVLKRKGSSNHSCIPRVGVKCLQSMLFNIQTPRGSRVLCMDLWSNSYFNLGAEWACTQPTF